jgi:hypothetical protein
MINSFFRNSSLDICYMVGHLSRKVGHARDERFGIKTQFLGCALPVTTADVTKAIFIAELHGEFDSLKVDVVIRENTRNVV